MSFSLLVLAAALAQQPAPPAPDPAQKAEQNLPEEDENLKREDIHYVFNPLRAKKEIAAGDFYRKQRHDFKGARARYVEATRWNPTSQEAFLKLAEADEAMADSKAAREAYQHYLDLGPDPKHAGEIKKRIDKLPAN